MRYVLAFLGVVLVALVASSVVSAPSSLDFARQDAAIAAVHRAESLAEMLQPLDVAVAVVWRLWPVVLALGVSVWAAGLGVAHVYRVALERRPDGRGLVPVPLADLSPVAAAALGSYHATQQAAAVALRAVPHTVTYAPHTSSTACELAGVAPSDGDSVTPNVTPSFASLLDARRIGRGNPLCLGYADGIPIDGSWLDLYSCGVGGLAGSGKTWTAVYLASQAALFGTRFVICDPHAGDKESLSARLAPLASAYVCGVASDLGEMRSAVGLVSAELSRRKAGGSRDPWLFICDEYSALQRGELAGPLGELIEALGQEGRKLGLYALVCGQIWSGSRAGGTETRDSLASAYLHRLRPAQARMLSGLTAAELPSDLLSLPAGSAYLLSTAGDLRRVTVPQMTAVDVARVAGLLGAPTSRPTTGPRPLGFRPGRVVVASEVANGEPLPARSDALNWTPDDAAILALLQAGKTPGEVAQSLAGGVKGGRAYADASRKVAAVVARLAVLAGAVR